MDVNTVTEIDSLTALIVAVGGIVGAITSLVVAIRAHGKANVAATKADAAAWNAAANGKSTVVVTPGNGVTTNGGSGDHTASDVDAIRGETSKSA
jgi:gas vesicle protein